MALWEFGTFQHADVEESAEVDLFAAGLGLTDHLIHERDILKPLGHSPSALLKQAIPLLLHGGFCLVVLHPILAVHRLGHKGSNDLLPMFMVISSGCDVVIGKLDAAANPHHRHASFGRWDFVRWKTNLTPQSKTTEELTRLLTILGAHVVVHMELLIEA